MGSRKCSLRSREVVVVTTIVVEGVTGIMEVMVVVNDLGDGRNGSGGRHNGRQESRGGATGFVDCGSTLHCSSPNRSGVGEVPPDLDSVMTLGSDGEGGASAVAAALKINPRASHFPCTTMVWSVRWTSSDYDGRTDRTLNTVGFRQNARERETEYAALTSLHWSL
ncbi:unnamed protein product [Schistocephalus solidus]|uniref:Uncharacterized protein n=1 Tax=Schistocephalus solidus TaxID=70667 RepID=A0A183TU82_SCHSO|nr:unnamed protein product [Schistocephalus solidus]